MQIELIAIDNLTPYARNARTHSPDQIAQIAASIGEFGFTNPILIGADDVIIAGHGRLMAAQRLGLTEVPVIVLDHLTETQRRALVIADNRIAENAGWDEELLRSELAALQGLDFDLDLVGFSDDELADLLGEMEAETGTGDAPVEEDIPDLPEDPVTRPGDIWILGDHRLMCGDSTDAAALARLMGTQQATLLFTSPPYGQQRDYGAAKEQVSDWDRLMQGVFAAAPITDDAQLLINLGLVHRDSEWILYWDAWIQWMRTQGWRRFGWYVWDQGPGLPGDWNGRLAPAHEFIFHFNRAPRRPNKTVESKHAGEVLGGGGLRAADGTVSAKHGAGNAIQSHRIGPLQQRDQGCLLGAGSLDGCGDGWCNGRDKLHCGPSRRITHRRVTRHPPVPGSGNGVSHQRLDADGGKPGLRRDQRGPKAVAGFAPDRLAAADVGLGLLDEAFRQQRPQHAIGNAAV